MREYYSPIGEKNNTKPPIGQYRPSNSEDFSCSALFQTEASGHRAASFALTRQSFRINLSEFFAAAYPAQGSGKQRFSLSKVLPGSLKVAHEKTNLVSVSDSELSLCIAPSHLGIGQSQPGGFQKSIKLFNLPGRTEK